MYVHACVHTSHIVAWLQLGSYTTVIILLDVISVWVRVCVCVHALHRVWLKHHVTIVLEYVCVDVGVGVCMIIIWPVSINPLSTFESVWVCVSYAYIAHSQQAAAGELNYCFYSVGCCCNLLRSWTYTHVQRIYLASEKLLKKKNKNKSYTKAKFIMALIKKTKQNKNKIKNKQKRNKTYVCTHTWTHTSAHAHHTVHVI